MYSHYPLFAEFNKETNYSIDVLSVELNGDCNKHMTSRNEVDFDLLYTIGKLIGTGGSGNVYECTCKSTQQVFAVKVNFYIFIRMLKAIISYRFVIMVR